MALPIGVAGSVSGEVARLAVIRNIAATARGSAKPRSLPVSAHRPLVCGKQLPRSGWLPSRNSCPLLEAEGVRSDPAPVLIVRQKIRSGKRSARRCYVPALSALSNGTICRDKALRYSWNAGAGGLAQQGFGNVVLCRTMGAGGGDQPLFICAKVSFFFSVLLTFSIR